MKDAFMQEFFSNVIPLLPYQVGRKVMKWKMLWKKCLSCGYSASIGSYEFQVKAAGLEDGECPLCGRSGMSDCNYNPLETYPSPEPPEQTS